MLSILFCGGWQLGFPVDPKFIADHPFWYGLACVICFVLKIVFWFFMFAIAKAIVPRYRYDQLMRLGWKIFLPMSLGAVLLVAAWRVYFGGVL
jgi:NADH-quinone oxidoreductase subunit H